MSTGHKLLLNCLVCPWRHKDGFQGILARLYYVTPSHNAAVFCVMSEVTFTLLE